MKKARKEKQNLCFEITEMATAKVKAIDIKSCHLEVRKIGPCDAGQIVFENQSGEIMRFNPNGDIFIKGRLAANDKEVVDTLGMLHHSVSQRNWSRSKRVKSF